MQQEVRVSPGATTGVVDINRVTLTGELYRTAALLYLEQVMNNHSKVDPYVVHLVDHCFSILDQLRMCTSPWPLFILASWSSTDEQRIKIMATLEFMKTKRRIGNVEVIDSIIRTLWRQSDLRTTEHSYKALDWRNIIDTSSFLPSFI